MEYCYSTLRTRGACLTFAAAWATLPEPSQRVSNSWIPLSFWMAASATAAWWVRLDARARGRVDLARAWGLGTLFFAGLAFPYYVLFVRPRRPGDRDWDLAGVTAIAILSLTAPLFVLAAGHAIGHDAIDQRPTFWSFATMNFLQNFVWLAGSFYLVVWRYGRSLLDLGLHLTQARTQAWLAALTSIPLIIAVYYFVRPTAVWLLGLFLGSEAAVSFAEREETSNPILSVLPSASDPLALAALVLLVCVFVPLAEETFFRGLLYRTLNGRKGMWRAAAISAAVFAAAHGQVVNFLPIFVLGYALAVAYELTGSLIAPIMIHVINNVVAMIGAYAGGSK
ncbi:MAG: CPBP family intramembrane metalloprotease [Armatimonadetes bacterium]|nr:CPBP family intramembrane metalloprotease [Armatimonadota bacterium]